MSTTRTIEKQQGTEIFDEAMRERRRIVLTHHGSDGWRLFKAQFAPEASPGSLCVQLDPEDAEEARAAFRAGQTVGGTFRVGHKKCMFSSRINSMSEQGGQLLAHFPRPDQLQQLQRRAYERAIPPSGAVVAVRFWRDVESQGAAVDTRKVRHGQLEDISAGGMRIKIADVSGIEMEATYRCVFTPRAGRSAFVLDAFLRHRAALDQGRASLGFQFVGLETTEEGRQTLNRLARFVNQLHRAHQRRKQPKGK